MRGGASSTQDQTPRTISADSGYRSWQAEAYYNPRWRRQGRLSGLASTTGRPVRRPRRCPGSRERQRCKTGTSERISGESGSGCKCSSDPGRGDEARGFCAPVPCGPSPGQQWLQLKRFSTSHAACQWLRSASTRRHAEWPRAAHGTAASTAVVRYQIPWPWYK